MDPAGRFRAHRHRTGSALKIRALGFDFDHTLGIDNKLERVSFLHLLEEASQEGARAVGTLPEEIAQIDGLLERQRAGQFSIEAAVERFIAEHGIAQCAPYIERYKSIALANVDAFVVADPQTAQLLRELREREIPRAILTNGWSPLQERKAQRIGFDGPVVVSATIGAQKPQAAAFQALADALGAASDQVGYVGDNPEVDVGGAIAAGMAGIWFDAEAIRYPRHVAPPSAVIHRLTELTRLL